MNFTTKTLGDICDEVDGIIRTGPFGSQLHESDYLAEGLPVVMPKNIIEGGISIHGIARIGDKDVIRLSQHKLQKGDIVYGRRGDIGRRAFISEREEGWLCGTGCLRISLGDTVIDPLFLYYYLGQPDIVTWIQNQAIGSTMPNLNTSILRSVEIKYPSLPIQRRIADILSAYDDLIENNARRIAILEEMARNLYREWFVEFRFPGHEQVPVVDGMPEGWEHVPYTELVDVQSGGTPKTSFSQYWENGNIPWFTPRDKTGYFYVHHTNKSITESGLNSCNSRLFPRDTVFITARGTVGECVLNAVPMAMNQTCYALRARKLISQYTVFLMTLNMVDWLKKNATGVVFDAIVVETFKQYKVVRPDDEIELIFHQQVKPIFDMICNLLEKNDNLRRTRDLLLPHLISGDLDVAALAADAPAETIL